MIAASETQKRSGVLFTSGKALRLLITKFTLGSQGSFKIFAMTGLNINVGNRGKIYHYRKPFKITLEFSKNSIKKQFKLRYIRQNCMFAEVENVMKPTNEDGRCFLITSVHLLQIFV